MIYLCFITDVAALQYTCIVLVSQLHLYII